MARKRRGTRKTPSRSLLKVGQSFISWRKLKDLLRSYGGGDLDDRQFMAELDRLAGELGQATMIKAMLGWLEKAQGPERTGLMVAIPHLGDEETAAQLWHMVEAGKGSLSARMTALTILQSMGEDVDPDHPERYFKISDATPATIEEAEGLLGESVAFFIQQVQRAESLNDIEALTMRLNEMPGKMPGGEQALIYLIGQARQRGDTAAADFLSAITQTTSHQQVKKAAERALRALRQRGVEPQSKLVKALSEDRFYKAYTTDPDFPWQRQVTLAWERGKDKVQAMVFLLDWNEWHGGIKDMFVTHDLSKQQFRQQLVTGAERRMGIPTIEISFEEARRMIVDALEANKRYRQRLPKEYFEFKHLIERRILQAEAQ